MCSLSVLTMQETCTGLNEESCKSCESYQLSLPGLHKLSKFFKTHKSLFFVSQMKIIKKGSHCCIFSFFFNSNIMSEAGETISPDDPCL